MNPRRPPAAHNAVRFLGPTHEVTRDRVFRFLKGSPRITYQPAYAFIHDRIQGQISHDTMLAGVARIKGDLNRRLNREVVSAYIENEEEIDFQGMPGFDDQVVQLRASADIILPVRPTAVVVGDNKFRVLTCLGWSGASFSHYQKRLWMTIYDDALFSLSDFQNADGVFAMFPRTGEERELLRWERGDFDLVPMAELNDQLEMLSGAITEAQAMYEAWKRDRDAAARARD